MFAAIKAHWIGWTYLAALPLVFILGIWAGGCGRRVVVVEVETDRLVCVVVSTRVGNPTGVSCVPKIPGLFDEVGER